MDKEEYKKYAEENPITYKTLIGVYAVISMMFTTWCIIYLWFDLVL